MESWKLIQANPIKDDEKKSISFFLISFVFFMIQSLTSIGELVVFCLGYQWNHITQIFKISAAFQLQPLEFSDQLRGKNRQWGHKVIATTIIQITMNQS